MLVASARAQQMCLSSGTSLGADGAVTFDDVSTLGTLDMASQMDDYGFFVIV